MSEFYLVNEVSPGHDILKPEDVSVFASRWDVETYFEPWFADESYLLLNKQGERKRLIPDGHNTRIVESHDNANYADVLQNLLIHYLSAVFEARGTDDSASLSAKSLDELIGLALDPKKVSALDISSLTFPVMLFEDGYVYVATTPSELQTGSQSELAQSEWRIVDSSGRLMKVVAWKAGPKPKGLNALLAFITRTTTTTPIVAFEQSHSVQSFVEKIEPMLLEYRMYGNAYGDDQDAYLQDLRKIRSFPELFAFVEDAV